MVVEDEFKMGNVYYCLECKRNHTKGQIYLDHLKYAQLDDSGDNNNYEDDDEIMVAFSNLDDTFF